MENTNEKRLYQVAEIQLTYKSNVKPSLRPKINGSRDAFNILKESWDESRIELVEQFKVMLTNRANKVLGISHSFLIGQSRHRLKTLLFVWEMVLS